MPLRKIISSFFLTVQVSALDTLVTPRWPITEQFEKWQLLWYSMCDDSPWNPPQSPWGKDTYQNIFVAADHCKSVSVKERVGGLRLTLLVGGSSGLLLAAAPCWGWCWWCPPRAPSCAPSAALYLLIQSHRYSSRTRAHSIPCRGRGPGLCVAETAAAQGPSLGGLSIHQAHHALMGLWWAWAGPLSCPQPGWLLQMLSSMWLLAVVPLSPLLCPLRAGPLQGALPPTPAPPTTFVEFWGK